MANATIFRSDVLLDEQAPGLPRNTNRRGRLTILGSSSYEVATNEAGFVRSGSLVETLFLVSDLHRMDGLFYVYVQVDGLLLKMQVFGGDATKSALLKHLANGRAIAKALRFFATADISEFETDCKNFVSNGWITIYQDQEATYFRLEGPDGFNIYEAQPKEMAKFVFYTPKIVKDKIKLFLYATHTNKAIGGIQVKGGSAVRAALIETLKNAGANVVEC